MKVNGDMLNARIKSKKDFLNFRRQIIPMINSQKIDSEFFSKSNSIFVGEYNYPSVNVGVLSSPNKNLIDNSKVWIKENWEISKIAQTRLSLVNSKKSNTDIFTSAVFAQQEIALSKKPTAINIQLSSIPKGMSYDSVYKPIGPSADLKKLILIENPRIPTITEKIISDDLKATEGLNILYKKGFETDYLTQALTSGSLGERGNKKLVPTRWGITAVDDTIGKELIKKVKDFKKSGNFAFQGGYLGNYFIILFFDGEFGYELIEFFKDSLEVTTDYENFFGRKNYAMQTAGGYYAARISILEKLKLKKMQSQVLALRYITDEYYMPLGVWVVREAVINTLDSSPIEFGSEELMIKYAEVLSKKKFGRDISKHLKDSKLIINRTQKKIFDY